MKKFLLDFCFIDEVVLVVVILILLSLCGCSTTSTMTTFDDKGNIIKVEEIEKGAIDKLMESVKDKTIIVWRSGWAGYISASPATFQDPTPSIKIFAGKMNEGYISLNKEVDVNWSGLANAISATNNTLNISATGINEEK